MDEGGGSPGGEVDERAGVEEVDDVEHVDEAGEADERELDAHAQARRRLALAQIRQYPDAVLRMRAREVQRYDADLERLAGRMEQLMHDARGIGLAATQVGVLQRLFVFQPHEEDETLAVVNPEITARSAETDVLDEGCLSLQGVHVPVERSLRVTLEGRDVSGAAVRYELEELAARVAQHELDHLDGVLMLERTDDDSRRAALATLRRTL